MKIKMKYVALFFPLFFIDACSNKDTCSNMSSNEVCVTISNQSDYNTKSLILKHENKIIALDNPAKNSKTSIKYNSPGENLFQLVAILENDDTLKSADYYTEGGYRFQAVITKDSIKIEEKHEY